MKTIQEMLQELSQCIVTVSGEFRFRTNWNGGKVPQPDLDTFDPNVPFCIENVGDVPVEFGLYDYYYDYMPFILHVRKNCKISYNLKTWQDYDIVSTKNTTIPDVNKITLKNNGDRVYIKADFSIPPRTENYYTRFIVLNQSKDTKIRARGNIISLNNGSDDKYKTDYLKLVWKKHNYCFRYFFKDCTSLIQAPELPSTELTVGCYQSMFENCASLTQVPAELPATFFGGVEISGESVYAQMFKGCTSLTQAPKLPSTELSFSCYSEMFSGCTSLIQAPELPATTLVNGCYYSMFSGCTSLVQAPKLPVTKLADHCYLSMFNGCASLTQAPDLPATKLANSCYQSMFSGCTKLNYVKCLATDTLATDCTTDWLYNVASTGTFECDNKEYYTLNSSSGIPSGWTITEINPVPIKPDLDTFDPNVPFCIENVGDVPVEIGIYNTTSNIRTDCEISYNIKDWITYTLKVDPSPSDIEKITLSNKGDRVYIKANHPGTTTSPTPYTRIKVLNESTNTKIQARGNIASLNYASNDRYKTDYIYLPYACYLGLFMSCESLVKAPELRAINLSKLCYMSMFHGCTNLKYISCYANDKSADNCTFEWVKGVSATGDFYALNSAAWSSDDNGIPSGWTRHNV